MSVKPKIKKSKDDILSGLKDQIDILKSLCNLYDGGNKNISKSIAVSIRVLCHNTAGPSKSLTHQSGLDHIDFADTTPEHDLKNSDSKWGLINLQLHNNIEIGKAMPPEGVKLWSELSPKLGVDFNKLKLDEWWDGKNVFSDKFGSSFTRKVLVKEVADTDGGAHFDGAVNADYFDIVKNNAIGIVYKQDGHNLIMKIGIPGKDYPEEKNDLVVDIENPIPDCIRQIAHELILTFDQIDIAGESKLP